MTRLPGPRAAPSLFKTARLLAFLLPISIQSCYVFRDADGWLFENFSLFSALSKSTTATRYSIYGVRQGDGTEVRLDESAYWAPLDLLRIRAALDLVARASKDDERRFLVALKERYRLNAERGRHAGPPLDSIRIYRVTYDWAAGVDRPTSQRTLVMER